ncbi:hypothetical protein N1851_022890 [Merluccius polli]|uniref:Uncharacterized protein n=1 Tax=Merluccius polli TaxID=89951 RepID=A0AA47MHI3_MERPO|nr:hypothetical protein N1851_022890 [Merluccius polli]
MGSSEQMLPSKTHQSGVSSLSKAAVEFIGLQAQWKESEKDKDEENKEEEDGEDGEEEESTEEEAMLEVEVEEEEDKKIRETLVDHVVNHGLTLREAGLRVQPNLNRYTVASVIRTFRLENRIEGQERQGGRPPMFTEQQEREIVNMVLANNAITLNQLQANIVNNHAIFNDIHQVSTSTLACILKKKHIQMKQLYRVPFERNSERVKQLRHDYAERVLQMDGEEIQHEFIYVDEAGFKLTRTRRRGRNIIGHRAIVNVPGQLRGRGQGGARGGRGGGRGRVRRRNRITDDIRATIVDHVINHGMTLREAGQRVQPNLSRYTVESIIRTFRNENRIARCPDVGGRGRMFTPEQEPHIVNMVIANNAIRLREIQQRIIDNDTIFQNIRSVSMSVLSRVLARNRIRMKQIYRVPFERNSERVKQLRYEYVQRVMELEADAMGHELLFVDEAGFTVTSVKQGGVVGTLLDTVQ